MITNWDAAERLQPGFGGCKRGIEALPVEMQVCQRHKKVEAVRVVLSFASRRRGGLPRIRRLKAKPMASCSAGRQIELGNTPSWEEPAEAMRRICPCIANCLDCLGGGQCSSKSSAVCQALQCVHPLVGGAVASKYDMATS